MKKFSESYLKKAINHPLLMSTLPVESPDMTK